MTNLEAINWATVGDRFLTHEGGRCEGIIYMVIYAGGRRWALPLNGDNMGEAQDMSETFIFSNDARGQDGVLFL